MAKKKESLTPAEELKQLAGDLKVLELDKASGGNVEPIDQTIKAINERVKVLKKKGS